MATAFSLIITSIVRLIEIKIIFGLAPLSLKRKKLFILNATIILICLIWLSKTGMILRCAFITLILAYFVSISFKLVTREDSLVWGLLKRQIFFTGKQRLNMCGVSGVYDFN